jgi:hypothetical protein
MSQKPLDQVSDVGALRIMVRLLRAENDELRELIRRMQALERDADPQEHLVESEI